MAKEKNLTAVTSVAAADFLRVVTSAGASVKATASNLAKYIIETYNGSTVAGSAQSVKSALDSLNSKMKVIASSGTSGTFAVNSYVDNGSQFIAMTFGEVYVVYIDWSRSIISQSVLGRAGATRGVTFSVSDASTHTVAYTATASLWGGMLILN